MEQHEEFCFHNDAITEFNKQLYSSVFTKENIISRKKAIRLNKDEPPYYGYFLEKGKIVYFVQDTDIDKLPFKIDKQMEFDYKGEVYTSVGKVTPIKIPSEKKMSWRQLVNKFAMFRHSKQNHFLLYKLIILTAYVDRINFRMSTPAGFGKDSGVSIIQALINSTANLYGATFAKLEFVLFNKLIILNELGNLKADDKINMQEYLLATGAYFNTYTKRSRKTADTQEQYDISKTSLGIFYNLPEYYKQKGQEYFEEIFTKAVANRFIPFHFEGQLTTKFEQILDIPSIVEQNKQVYKDVIATINYFKENNIKDIKWKVNKNNFAFGDELMRYERTFNVILKYIAEYSETQEEFDELSKELYKCYKSYNKLIEKETTNGKLSELGIK